MVGLDQAHCDEGRNVALRTLAILLDSGPTGTYEHGIEAKAIGFPALGEEVF